MTTEHVFPQSIRSGDIALSEGGLTLRDYFAAKAMQALYQRDSNYERFDGLAEDAYSMADAMLRARQQPTTTE